MSLEIEAKRAEVGNMILAARQRVNQSKTTLGKMRNDLITAKTEMEADTANFDADDVAEIQNMIDYLAGLAANL